MSNVSAPMRIWVGAAGEFREGDRKLVPVDDYEIGVFRVDGAFVAYRNLCLHQGGPVCEGRYFPRLTTLVSSDGQVHGERYDRSEPHLVCPWHGWEYDLRSGELCGSRRGHLRSYPVEIERGEVYVIVS